MSRPSTEVLARYLMALYDGPLLQADAIVCLTGDGLTRAGTALGLFIQGVAPTIVVSGSVDDPPYSLTSEVFRDHLIGAGVAPDRILVRKAEHTGESAEDIVKLCEQRQWRRILLATSSYHLPRALLSFERALRDAALDEVIDVVPVAAWAPQSAIPEYQSRPRATRSALMEEELRKVEEYGLDPLDGLDYLLWWDANR